MRDSDLLDTHRQELRRGSAVLASLLALREPGHGYGLLDVLAGAGVPVAANTLYPLLRRLEGQGLLTSEWDTTQARPRKIYRTSDDGLRLAKVLRREWQEIDSALERLDPDPAPGPEPDLKPGPKPDLKPGPHADSHRDPNRNPSPA